MAWIGAAIAGGVALMGDSMSQSGQQQTNAMNMQEIQQEEQWETQMSNTAVQRRVSDLQAAGINPMLAAGDPASTPGIGSISLQNPNAAFGNLGAQASSALANYQQGEQVQSNVQLNSANAAKANADAALSTAQAAKLSGVDTDVARESVNSQRVQQALNQAYIGQAEAQGKLSSAQAQVAQGQLGEIQARIGAIGAAKSLDEANTRLSDLSASMSKLNQLQFQSISPYLIQSAANAARSSSLGNQLQQLELPHASADSAMWQNNPGLSYVNAVMNWLHLGANIGGR